MGGELHGPLTQNRECFLRLIICYCLMEFSVHSFAKFHFNIRLWFFFLFCYCFCLFVCSFGVSSQDISYLYSPVILCIVIFTESDMVDAG